MKTRLKNQMHCLVFCQVCNKFLDLSETSCGCGHERPKKDIPTKIDQLQDPYLQVPYSAIGKAEISGDFFLLPYGHRKGGRSGVSIRNRWTKNEIYNLEAANAVEGGVAVEGDYAYFANLGYPKTGAKLFGYQISEGRKLFEYSLDGKVWSSPIIYHDNIYVGTDQMKIYCFTTKTGEAIPQWTVSIPGSNECRLWIKIAGAFLITVSQNGEINKLDPSTGAAVYRSPICIGSKITSALTIHNKTLYVGTEDGKIISIDLEKCTHHQLASGYKARGYKNRPVYYDDKLFIGAPNRSLHIIDASTGRSIKRISFGHSISAAPVFMDDLVFVGVNGTGVFAIDTTTYQQPWKFNIPNDAILTDPIIHEGVIYFGTQKGNFYALPWHLGYYEWAAEWLERREEYSEAAAANVVAADSKPPDQREDFYCKAGSLWNQAGENEWAARMWEGLNRNQEAADAYRYAGDCKSKSTNKTDREHSLDFYWKAVNLYRKVKDPKNRPYCLRRIREISSDAVLEPSQIKKDEYQPGKWESVSFRLENTGNGSAEDLKVIIHCTGIDDVRRDVGSLPPDSWLDIWFDLKLYGQYNELQVDFVYPPLPVDPICKKLKATQNSHHYLDGKNEFGNFRVYDKEMRRVNAEGEGKPMLGNEDKTKYRSQPSLFTFDTFELLIGKRQRKSYPVTVTRSTAGDANALMRLDPQQAPLSGWLNQLQNGYCTAADLVDAGKSLYQSLFAEDINVLYRSALSQARATGKGLRICLRIEPPELASLPWELLYSESEDAFLAISPETPLSRYISLQNPVHPPQVTLPLHILVVISQPIDLPRLDVEREHSIILEAWQAQIEEGLVKVDFVERATLTKISQALRTHRPHIFHFIGHGSFKDNQAMIALENEQGESCLKDDHTFREFFSGILETRLVVLNACQSGQTSSAQALAGMAPLLLQRQIGAVVAMRYLIPDQASLVFAREFYRSLALDYPVDAAVAEARKGLFMENSAGSRDWLTPALFMRAQDGRVFEMQKAEETAQPPASASGTVTHNIDISNISGAQINVAGGKITQATATLSSPTPPGQVAAGSPRLTSDLYNRIRQVLLDCGPFESDRNLRAVFIHPDLRPWQNGLPQASSMAERVDLLIAYLANQRHRDGRNALKMFLIALYENLDPSMDCYERLKQIADEMA